MKYLQITKSPTGNHTRVITETQMIDLISQILLLKQAGEKIEWTSVHDYDCNLVRYVSVRQTRRGAVINHFIPTA